MTLPKNSWLIFLALAAANSLPAVEISGTVREASGDTATIVTEGDVLPSVGDKAEIFFKLPGTDDEISVAIGRVLKVDGESIQIKIENATGDMAKDNLVRINSDKPQKRVHAQATGSPSPTTPAPPVAETTTAPGASSTPTPAVAVTTPTPAAATSATSGRDPGFAFLDMNKIFKEHPKAKESELKINAAKNAAKQEYDKRRAAKAPNLDEWFSEKEKQLQALAKKFRDEIVAEMKGKITILSAQNVNLVFDTSGNTPAAPFIVHFPSGADMSARVTAALQSPQVGQFEATRGLRIGVVNMNDIFGRARKTKEAEAKINATKETAKKEFDRRAAAYKKDSDRIESLSGAARDKALAKLQTAEKEINAFRVAKEKELVDQSQVVTREIVDEIVRAVREAVKGENSALILDAGGESSKGIPVLVVNGQLPDLSNEIVATVNGGSSRPTSAPSLTSSSTLRFACVDMRRAAAALPPNDSMAAIQFIERVRRIAATEKFDLVLDSGGLSANGLPLLLSAREIPDLTDKIMSTNPAPERNK